MSPWVSHFHKWDLTFKKKSVINPFWNRNNNIKKMALAAVHFRLKTSKLLVGEKKKRHIGERKRKNKSKWKSLEVIVQFHRPLSQVFVYKKVLFISKRRNIFKFDSWWDFHCKIKAHFVRCFLKLYFIDTHIISGYRYSSYFIIPVNRQRDPHLPL